MNILLIDHYAGSLKYGMEYRPYYLGREWVNSGHKVTVIGSSFSHLRTIQPAAVKKITKENIDGINYIWIKGNSYKSSLSRIANIISFVFTLYLKAEKIAKDIRPDVVINSSTYPLDIYPARKIARLTKAKLIYEIHDIWPLSPMLIGGYSKNHPFIKVMQRAEDDCYKYCNKVISLLWNAEEHIKERHFDDVKFACIPNGYSQDEWDNHKNEMPDNHSDLFNKLKSEDKFIIGYSGGHAPSTALNTLIGAACLLKRHRHFAFVLVGDGISKKELMERTKQEKLENVYFLPPVKKTCIPELIRRFDIAYMGGIHSILHKYGTSLNKMTDYMLSSKPIVFSIDEPDSLVERLGCGIRVEAESPRQVADAIMTLAAKSKDELKEMGERGRKYALENLEYGALAEKFIEAIEHI